MIINSSESHVPTEQGNMFVEMDVEYVLSKDFSVIAYRGADRECTRLKAGQRIKKIKTGNICSPAEWEVLDAL